MSDDGLPVRPAAADQSETTAPLESGALDAVIRATRDADVTSATGEEIEALRELARQRADLPFQLDPVVVELVETIIRVNYRQLGRPPEVWRAMAEKIAGRLFDSPAARARLENLWRHLIEARC